MDHGLFRLRRTARKAVSHVSFVHSSRLSKGRDTTWVIQLSAE